MDVSEEISNVKCDHCSKPFETTKQLQHHEEMNQFGWDECFHCYTSKFYADLHELEQLSMSVTTFPLQPRNTLQDSNIRDFIDICSLIEVHGPLMSELMVSNKIVIK